MDIIVVSHERGRTWRFSFGARSIKSWSALALGMLTICGATFAAGYSARGAGSVLPESLVEGWSSQASVERMELAKARDTAMDEAQALSRRIALLQAHVLRLDAAGQRLTQMAGIDAAEFDFANSPSLGGPESEEAGGHDEAASLVEALSSLQGFEQKLSERERQMRVLEDLLMVSHLQKQVRPSGWPVDIGYISSTFGWRTDPLNGRSSMHSGIDFAGAAGSDVLAVASGIVVHAGADVGYDGYGQLVEINHGNGYVTRYGHNKKILVKVGDRVEKGQRVALMGSTGRSTGNHVHFEVLLNGRVVNPTQYIQASR